MIQWRFVAKIAGYTGYWFTNRNMRAKRTRRAATQNFGDTLDIPWCPLRHATDAIFLSLSKHAKLGHL